MKQEIEFASHPANLAPMRDFVRQFLGHSTLPPTEAELIVLGLDEACTNIIRHAYKHVETHLIALSCETADNCLCFRLRDYGEQKDPREIEGRPLDMIQPGGLGLHLIRRAFDSVDYNLKKRGTELVLRKDTTSGLADPKSE